MLMIGALGARMEDRHDDVGSRRGLPHESLRRVNVEQALRPRVRREAEDRHAYAVFAEDRDLVRSAAPAQPVMGECSQGLLLAGRAVVEGVVVRDIEVVEPCAAQQGGRSRGSLEGVAARASRLALRASSGAERPFEVADRDVGSTELTAHVCEERARRRPQQCDVAGERDGNAVRSRRSRAIGRGGGRELQHAPGRDDERERSEREPPRRTAVHASRIRRAAAGSNRLYGASPSTSRARPRRRSPRRWERRTRRL